MREFRYWTVKLTTSFCREMDVIMLVIARYSLSSFLTPATDKSFRGRRCLKVQ